MSFSAAFIARPVATTLLTVGLTLAGILAFGKLPVSPLPQVDFPTISVQAALPGADPETMATSVAAPLERQFARIAGVTEMTSTSYRGTASVTLQFDLDRNIDGAARDVQAAIAAARGFLPPNMPNNPTYRKVNPADAPILILALTSESVEIARMYDAASTILQQRLAQVPGVGQVFVGGSSLPAVRVELNPKALSAYKVSLEDVRTTLANSNVNRPKGAIDEGPVSYQIDATDQLHQAWQYLPLVVRYQAGRALTLSDVAEVTDSVEDVRAAGMVGGTPAVMLVCFRQPGANIIETVDAVRRLMPQLAASLPGGVNLDIVLDRTPPIRGSLHDVEITLIISCILVILVVFVFLRDVRSTIIPGVAVVCSLIGTFAFMYLFGYSLDNLSLMALTIATGFVVDDAIVVLENITRHIENGVPPVEASYLGSREISFTVVSMSVSLVAVFIPILLMGGMVGRLFREFAVTLSAAIFVSMVLSLTTTPMMCAALLTSHHRKTPGAFFRISERFFNGMLALYERSLGWALGHSRLMLGLTVATLAINVYLYILVPKGFFPQQDTGRVVGMIQAAQDISFTAMKQKLREVVGILRTDPDVEYAIGFTGGGGGGGSTTNTARIFLSLKPYAKRTSSMNKLLARLRGRLSGVVGAPTFLQPVQDLRVGGRISNALYQFTLQSDNFADLSVWGQRMLGQMRQLRELVDVSSDQQDKGLESRLAIDRDTASRLGVNQRAIDNALYDAFGQRQVAVSYTMLNQYHVVMEVEPKYWQNPDTLSDLYVPATNGIVPLASFSTFTPKSSALAVNHQSQFPSVTVSFNLPPGTALGQAVEAIQATARKAGMPGTIRGSFQGTAQAFQDSLANQPILILAALIAVYIVLGILYESVIHPVTILSTLPSAGVGAVLALFASGTELSVIAMIGVILLIGIVKKNGIMMVDFAVISERERGITPDAAIFEACMLRFRPIMMTTFAALLGALPLAVGFGVGSELRRPLGVTIIGGLIVSQLLTLYTTPVIYLYLDRLRLWFKSLRRTRLG